MGSSGRAAETVTILPVCPRCACGTAPGAAGKSPPSQPGSPLLIQKLPRQEMRLLLRSSSSSQLSLPALLCFAAAIPSALPALCTGFCRGFLVCFTLPWAVFILRGAAGHPCGLVPWHGPVLASPGSAPAFGRCWGHPADVAGSGNDSGARNRCPHLLLPVRQLRGALGSLLLPSLHSKILRQTEA